MFLHTQKKQDPRIVTILRFDLKKNPLHGNNELQFVASNQVFAAIVKASQLISGAFMGMFEKFAYNAEGVIMMSEADFEKVVAAIKPGADVEIEEVGSYSIRSQTKEETVHPKSGVKISKI